LAIFAAAGLFAGGMATPSAKAADLGGDCCADLEERVAELEATTARKGNRKMGLTVTGQVNRIVMWYDDGHDSGTLYGLDNTNSSSRFSFIGSAKVTGKVSVGFDITIEHDAGASSSSVNQLDEDAGIFNYNRTEGYSDDTPLGARRMAWWIEHKDVGRMTVGRQESAGVVTTIDLGGIGVVASSSVALVGAGMFMRGPNGEAYAVKWGNLVDPADAQGRTELLRYDSPTIGGFILSASVGELDSEQWGVMLRYAGEFSGFRVAAGIGYERIEDRATKFDATACVASSSATCSQIDIPDTVAAANDTDIKAWGGSVAVMHVPSGIFVQGQYMEADFGNGTSSAYWNDFAGHRDSKFWQVQAGISKNWTGLGNTSIYGEYNKLDNWGAGVGAGKNWTAAAGNGFTNVNGVTDSEVTIWGVGIVQNLDAAATELYLGWRHYSADIVDNGGATTLDTEDLDIVMGGARVKF
jgi:hypothetical protein